MRQFGRMLQLKIGNQNESIIIDHLRVTFSIKKTLTSNPNAAEISIYNLNDSNRNLIATKQYHLLELSVCYKDDMLRLIFCGDIINVENKLNDKDIITVLRCGDGYKAFTEKTIIKTVAKGQTDNDLLNEAANSFGIQKGSINLPNDRVLPRGKVMMCDTREVMHEIAINQNADWFIQDGQLFIIPKNKGLANNEGWVISRTTGMIGIPQKNNEEVEVKTLCNPHYKVGSIVRIESRVSECNGDYKIKSIEHNGDLYGSNWYSKLVCTSGEFEEI
ncbi:phage protein [Frischella perrara]|uniref:phage protein n=1 Tax=Frischella perrara TaxID=1267021 RepID=UPI0023F11ADE|nr:hypothetical protein [Frischella perrara]MCT6876545.1 hypothetical protein [Frischella perrara]